VRVKDISRILILGAGAMGRQIGFQCAACGFDVTLYDTGDEVLKRALRELRGLSEHFVRHGRLGESEAKAALDRIKTETDPERAGADADLISESVPEDPQLKGDILGRFHGICPEHTIFTTNTSSLLPSMFAELTGRPDRFAALHFHDTRVTDIVDVMPHPGTSSQTTALIEEFARRIHQRPIVLHKENHGYVFNAMLMELLRSALTLAANGVVDIEDIDRSWTGIMHTRSGPFGIMDSIGLDTVYGITDYWARQLGSSQQRKNAEFLKTYVEQGLLGQKTGKGFYTYAPDPQDPCNRAP
jgi:3-hydroxybutyryl-CoA dehydrogenase